MACNDKDFDDRMVNLVVLVVILSAALAIVSTAFAIQHHAHKQETPHGQTH